MEDNQKNQEKSDETPWKTVFLHFFDARIHEGGQDQNARKKQENRNEFAKKGKEKVRQEKQQKDGAKCFLIFVESLKKWKHAGALFFCC
ncbi:hypothetical protein AGMMS50296_1880 [Alphaproteobacteria bacterium]|nr:hypothetical protein AGMMS50296_1880 [Alphaproteobacteria bacterium]